jgi:hypothetical protein
VQSRRHKPGWRAAKSAARLVAASGDISSSIRQLRLLARAMFMQPEGSGVW